MIFPAGRYKIVGLEVEDKENRKRAITLVDGDVMEVDSPFFIVHSRAHRRDDRQAIRVNLLVGEKAVVKINGRRYDE